MSVKPGRNDSCPCGSGKKYKQCCLLQETRPAANERPMNLSTPHAIQEALLHHQSGRLAEAEAIYRHVLQLEPDNADALYLLGVVALQAGQNEAAIELISKAIRVDSANPLYFLNLGAAYQALGLYNEAAENLHRAIALEPNFAEAHNSLGNVLRCIGKFEEALGSCRRALSIKPDYADALCNLGTVLQETGQLDEAVAMYQKALSLKPDFTEVLSNLGLAQREQGQFADALASCRRALASNPHHAEAHNNLGVVLHDLGQLTAAAESYQSALDINPQFADAHNNLGNAQRMLGQLNAAVLSCRSALAIQPEFAEAFNNLGNALRDLGQPDESMACLRRALALKPDFAEVRWKLAINTPLVAATQNEIDSCRAEFAREMTELSAWFEHGRIELGSKTVGSYQPFYLAYQEENNRKLLSQYGSLCAGLMQHWQDKQNFTQNFKISPVAPSGKVRVGIVSSHIHKHSVWDAIVKGWLTHLDPNRFEIVLFHVGGKEDAETAWAMKQVSSFEQGKSSLEEWTRCLLDKQADVLIYPEIGMDHMTVKLASLRLAPVQIASWGHPETTGLPTIDYYLSAEYLEPDDAQNNYTEKLICLPNLGCHYHPAQVNSTEPDLAGLGIASSLPILLCPGTPFKYAPQHDHVFVEIALQLGQCQLVFFTNDIPELSEKLYRRLDLVFAKANLKIGDFCVFIPWQEKAAFYGLMRRADVYLDTLGFSGFNTAMQAVECGLPIVTREGRFMRGRLASGILRCMELTELVVGTEAEYVNLAVRLARDKDFNQAVRHRIAMSREVLYNDVEPVRALQDFLTTVGKRVLTPAKLHE